MEMLQFEVEIASSAYGCAAQGGLWTSTACACFPQQVCFPLQILMIYAYLVPASFRFPLVKHDCRHLPPCKAGSYSFHSSHTPAHPFRLRCALDAHSSSLGCCGRASEHEQGSLKGLLHASWVSILV